jgi:hypothetical protein
MVAAFIICCALLVVRCWASRLQHFITVRPDPAAAGVHLRLLPGDDLFSRSVTMLFPGAPFTISNDYIGFGELGSRSDFWRMCNRYLNREEHFAVKEFKDMPPVVPGSAEASNLMWRQQTLLKVDINMPACSGVYQLYYCTRSLMGQAAGNCGEGGFALLARSEPVLVYRGAFQPRKRIVLADDPGVDVQVSNPLTPHDVIVMIPATASVGSVDFSDSSRTVKVPRLFACLVILSWMVGAGTHVTFVLGALLFPAGGYSAATRVSCATFCSN